MYGKKNKKYVYICIGKKYLKKFMKPHAEEIQNTFL